MNYRRRLVTLYRRQESRPSPRKSKNAKWLSEEVLQIAKERKEAKSKGERERYIQLNTDFQRTAWKDKKAVFNGTVYKTRRKQQKGKD